MYKQKIVRKKDVIAAIESAVKYRKSFSATYDFYPLDVLKGDSGYPDAGQLEIELFNANGDFLDDILKAMAKRENAYNLNKKNTIYCTWNTREARL